MIWKDRKGIDRQILCSVEDGRLSMLLVNLSCSDIILNNLSYFNVMVNRRSSRAVTE